MLQEIEFHKNKVHKYAADSPQIKITSSETWLIVLRIAAFSLVGHVSFRSYNKCFIFVQFRCYLFNNFGLWTVALRNLRKIVRSKSTKADGLEVPKVWYKMTTLTSNRPFYSWYLILKNREDSSCLRDLVEIIFGMFRLQ